MMRHQAVEKLITAESAEQSHALPKTIAGSLVFDLSVAGVEAIAPSAQVDND